MSETPEEYRLHHDWMSSGCPGQSPWDVEWLRGMARQVHSQHGEDGLVDAVFHRIGETNRHCFEFGAGDGRHLSNTLALRERGWSALLIEKEESAALMGLTDARTRCVDGCEVTPANVNVLLGGLPVDTDFGSIDIDREDYHVWSALTVVVPRVVCIEYNPYMGCGHEWVVPGEPCQWPAKHANGHQATLRPIKELGESKGYEMVAATFCNCLFVRSDQL